MKTKTTFRILRKIPSRLKALIKVVRIHKTTEGAIARETAVLEFDYIQCDDSWVFMLEDSEDSIIITPKSGTLFGQTFTINERTGCNAES